MTVNSFLTLFLWKNESFKRVTLFVRKHFVSFALATVFVNVKKVINRKKKSFSIQISLTLFFRNPFKKSLNKILGAVDEIEKVVNQTPTKKPEKVEMTLRLRMYHFRRVLAFKSI